MPYVNVRITKEGVTAEQKRRVIKGITDVLVKELGKNPDTTFVVIDEVELDNWGHKGTSVAELRKAKAAAAPVKTAAARAPAKKTVAKAATRKA
jgi:4-oxalocrotonate tautomerase